ncbi:MAG: M67 family metallopeptidase [Rhodospirillales bacterium]|nr:M67 family metallopeptidase [Rhodospirillales bacterium]
MIQIPDALVAAICGAAEGTYPEECCGLLIGHKDNGGKFTVSEIAASPNVAKGDHKDRFEVHPQVRFDVMRKLGDGPEQIIGHYHSHPDHAGEPSATDLEMAFEPEMVWLIVAVQNGLAQRPRAHIVDPATTRFREIEVHTP